MFSPFLIGFLLVVLIFGGAAAFLYSGSTGAVSLTRVGLTGTAGGLLGSVTMIFTDAWKVLVASLYGHLGMYGWILIGGIALCVGVWIFNAIQDAGKNKTISFVK